MDPDTLDQRTEEMIRRRVAGGANEAESRTMLAEFLTTAGRGFLPTALHYNGFATARGAETFTEAFFAEDPTTEQVADLTARARKTTGTARTTAARKAGGAASAAKRATAKRATKQA